MLRARYKKNLGGRLCVCVPVEVASSRVTHRKSESVKSRLQKSRQVTFVFCAKSHQSRQELLTHTARSHSAFLFARGGGWRPGGWRRTRAFPCAARTFLITQHGAPARVRVCGKPEKIINPLLHTHIHKQIGVFQHHSLLKRKLLSPLQSTLFLCHYTHKIIAWSVTQHTKRACAPRRQ